MSPRFLALRLLLCAVLAGGMVGCSAFNDAEPPAHKEKIQRQNRMGSVLGDDGIFFGAGTKKKGDEGAGTGGGIGVNSFLWRASLDSIGFMPLASADPFGGVIISDWYAS